MALSESMRGRRMSKIVRGILIACCAMCLSAVAMLGGDDGAARNIGVAYGIRN